MVLSDDEKKLLDNQLSGVCLVDTARRIQYWNSAAVDITGHRAEDVMGKLCSEDIIVHGTGAENYCDLSCPLRDVQKKAPPITIDLRLRHKNGYCLPGRLRCVPLQDGEGRIIGAFEVFERNCPEQDLVHRLEEMGQKAYIDALTAIPNRRCAEETLGEYLDVFEKKGHGFSVMMGDVDFFKEVNDTWGHDAGDLVLKTVAHTLRSNVRSLDMVSRWGGEEFFIIFKNADKQVVIAKSEALRSAVYAGRIPLGNRTIGVTMSFGCTNARKGDSMDSLVKRADACLYVSKNAGRNRVTIDHPA
jgi:diguanylate cyclase (GGDEF)-like protein/PAS domain S-box-containing protein